MMRRILKYLSLIYLILLTGTVRAQLGTYLANLDSIPVSGFYCIPLTPEIDAVSTLGYTDLRIVDPLNGEVPYIIQTSTSALDSLSLIPMLIVRQDNLDSSRSELIFQNADTGVLQSFSIKLGNSAIERVADLSGSTDGKQWFSILEGISLQCKAASGQPFCRQEVVMPPSHYPLYRILIHNDQRDPPHILSVDRTVTIANQAQQPWVSNPEPRFLQKDSNGVSYIHIVQGPAYQVTRIVFFIKSPTFFKREIHLLTSHQPQSQNTLSSDAPLVIEVPAFKDSTWDLEVINGDNPPLSIGHILTQHPAESLITYLKGGGHYTLQTGINEGHAPQYDLEAFKDKMPKLIPVLHTSDIQPVIRETPAISTFGGGFPWIWPVLILVLVILTLFTVKLVKETQKG